MNLDYIIKDIENYVLDNISDTYKYNKMAKIIEVYFKEIDPYYKLSINECMSYMDFYTLKRMYGELVNI